MLAALGFASAASADRLHLVDGESIVGTFISAEKGRVQWSSPMLGELEIDQSHVKYVESGEHFDVKTTGGELNNCWMYVQARRQHLHCEQGVQSLKSWKLIVAAGEPVISGPPTLAQNGTVRVAMEDSSGNNDLTKYNVEARNTLRYVESRHTLALLYQEESVQAQTTLNRWRGGYEYDQFLSEQWFATGNAYYDKDEFKDIEQRASVGLGMGYQFLETSFFDLSAKATVNYVDEQLTTGEDRKTPAVLWNLDFAWRLSDKGTQLFHRHLILQATNDREDFELDSVTGFRYPINGHFSSTIQLEYDYDRLPAESEVEKVDRKWSIGLNYDW